jgi:hypothetical protein
MKSQRAARSAHRGPLHRYVVTSLLASFFLSKKRRRPSRSDGGCCEKGVPSSGEKIFVSRN